MIDELAEGLLGAIRPQEVVRAAGAWLGGALAGEGFAWLPEQDTLRRERGHRVEEIGVGNALGNRADRKVVVELSMRIRDLDLGRWRQTLTPARQRRKGDFFASGRLEWLTEDDAGRPDLRDPATRVDTLTATVAALGDKALPWFDVMGDPESLARTAPPFAMVHDPDCVIEYLARHGRPDLVSVVVNRALTRTPTLRPGFDRGYRLALDGERPTSLNVGEDLGWLTATHGAPGYTPPADAVPPPAPLVFGGPVNVTEPLRKPDGTPALVALTGRIPGLTRDWFTATVTEFGGQAVDTISAAVDLLVVGERPNSRTVTEATVLGVPTVPEDTFGSLWYAHRSGDGDRIARVLGPALADRV